jgi:hypothetical protein
MKHQVLPEVLQNHEAKVLLMASSGKGENKELYALITFDPKMENHKISFQVLNNKKVVFTSTNLGMERAIMEYNKL